MAASTERATRNREILEQATVETLSRRPEEIKRKARRWRLQAERDILRLGRAKYHHRPVRRARAARAATVRPVRTR